MAFHAIALEYLAANENSIEYSIHTILIVKFIRYVNLQQCLYSRKIFNIEPHK